MVVDPLLPGLVLFTALIIAIGVLMRILKQPYVLAYIIVGILLGPSGFQLTDESLVSSLGGIGIILLLFFIGTEVSLHRLLSNWRIAIVGTFFQIAISVALVWLVGLLFNWSLEQSILFGFVISLSSTALVVKILQEWDELNTKVGQNIMGVLLVQDLAVIPMFIILGYFGGSSAGGGNVIIQSILGIAFLGILVWLTSKGGIKLPSIKTINLDHDTGIFAAFLVCFGLALFTSLFGLSTALGAFVAGILVSNARATKWFYMHLNPFRVILVAAFFIYIGAIINLAFLMQNIVIISLLVVAVFLTNTFVNAAVFRFLGEDWEESLYSGALLSQIGEFSFVLAAFGLEIGIIQNFGFQIISIVIAITLLLSPFWIHLMKHFTHADARKLKYRYVPTFIVSK